MSAQENVASHYSINEASKLTGLPSSTLRYYESIGIIKPVARDQSSKHRTYSQRDIDVLDTIACLNATGMKLDDMRTYIANLSDDATPFDDQIALLKAQQERLIEEARYVRANRMVWVAPRETPPALSALHESLAMELYREEFILERRPFAAHVTLIRDAQRAELPPLPAVQWPVNEFVLMRSSLSAAGAIYTAVERFPLA